MKPEAFLCQCTVSSNSPCNHTQLSDIFAYGKLFVLTLSSHASSCSASHIYHPSLAAIPPVRALSGPVRGLVPFSYAVNDVIDQTLEQL